MTLDAYSYASFGVQYGEHLPLAPTLLVRANFSLQTSRAYVYCDDTDETVIIRDSVFIGQEADMDLAGGLYYIYNTLFKSLQSSGSVYFCSYYCDNQTIVFNNSTVDAPGSDIAFGCCTSAR